ncbi:MAG: hypothetical protein IR160_00230 [Salinibacterium sp.]|nr:hypothetical protein [Salinibacterium sp.]MBF0670993.1 hypothetical protein [Salinibacterium sp.]
MTRIRAVVAATALCLTASLGLSGCATAGDYHHAAAERLQERVLGATAAAASADYATMLGALDALEVDLGDALARGHVTQARHDAIAAAIAHVRKDVEAIIAAQQPEPDPEPEPQPGSGEGNGEPKEPEKEKPDKPGKPGKPGKPEKPGGKGPGNKGGPGNNGKGNNGKGNG